MDIPEGYFKKHYPTRGNKFWLRHVSPEDLAAFVRCGMVASEYGQKGGRARAATAKRDRRGRFMGNG